MRGPMRGLLSILALSIGLTACDGLVNNGKAVEPPNIDTIIAADFSEHELDYIYTRSARFFSDTTKKFSRISTDNQVTYETVKLQIAKYYAEKRSKMLSGVLSNDLNGDGKLSAEEISQIALTQRRQILTSSEQEIISNIDQNGDGTITQNEVISYANKTLSDPEISTKSRTLLPLLTIARMDQDKDKIITKAELVTGLNALRKRANVPDEPHKPTSQNSMRAQNDPHPECAIKAGTFPNENAEIIFVSAYEGGALTNIAIAGPDSSAEVATLHIEPGQKPLYIVSASYTPMIWNFEGATDRVAQFVTTTRKNQRKYSGVGVKGLPREKVQFVNVTCVPKYRSKGAQPIDQPLKSLLKREADKTVNIYTVGKTKLPSGEPFEKIKRRYNGKKGPWASLNRFHPYGIIKFEKEDIISNKSVEYYDVMPQEAGLIQLVESGHLEIANDSLSRRAYKVTKPIPRFPAGLAGAHSVTFIMAQGIKPPGRAGHSKIIDHDGEPINIKR